MSSRITSNMLSTDYLRNMKRNLTNTRTLQNQLASGKEIQKASDNPYGASRSMQLHSEMTYNKQYNENIKDTSNWLDNTDTALSQIGNVFGRIEELIVNAGNGAYDQDERTAIKNEVTERVNQLSQILNTSFDGSFIFGGTKISSKPTAVVNGVIEYANADGSAVEITAYKDSTGKITNDNSPTQNTAVTSALTAYIPDPTTTDLVTERDAITTSPERKADIIKILSGSPVYYTDPTVPAAGGPIDSTKLTSEKYVTNTVVSTLSDVQKNDLINERNMAGTTQDRRIDITKILQGSTIYCTGSVPVSPTPIPAAQLTSEKYINKKITLSATDITGLQKELDGFSASDYNIATTTDPKYIRINDINSLLYNTDISTTGGLSLADIKTNQKTLKDLPTVPSMIQKNAADTASAALNKASKVISVNQTNSDLYIDISQGISSTYNKNAADVLEFTDKSGKKINVSDILKNIVADLSLNGDRNKLITTDLKDIQSITANLLQQRSEVGSMQNRMESAQSNNEDQNYNMTDILSKTEDIDWTETIMQSSIMQTVYTASLQTSAKILPMTILNYL